MEGELGFVSAARPSRDSSKGGDGCGFGSPTWASPLETLLDSSSSCVSDGRGGVNGGTSFSSPTRASLPETLLSSSSSCVSDGPGGGNGGSGFTSPLETLLDSPSSCVSDSGGGNSSSLGVSKERESELQEPERLLRAIAERYDDCFLRLRDATAELADLRRERFRLGAENLYLSLILEELEAEQSKQASAVALTPPPKPVQAEAAFGCAPKSISIRSKGFLSQKQPQGESKPQRLRVRASPAMEVSLQILLLFNTHHFTPPRALPVLLVGNLLLRK
ncbi:putative zinc finger CCCH domain-containing protein 21 [Phragmites australis]|uniref:putative zinc finger CCCH domain-containing protein 21 n=1 Tax=Phragmites australis TaxID=29695 RepID=UPI002D76C8AA|nr:putative zinc finger CCCH domain-containing protein 21 [Phragmites australis]